MLKAPSIGLIAKSDLNYLLFADRVEGGGCTTLIIDAKHEQVRELLGAEFFERSYINSSKSCRSP